MIASAGSAKGSSAPSFQVLPASVFDEVEGIRDLGVLAKRVREHHENSELLGVKAIDFSRQTINEALLCGWCLLQVRRLIPARGGWLAWLERFCPEVKRESARRYMAVALYYSRVGNISEFSSLTQIYVFLRLLPDRGEGKRAAKAVAFTVAWVTAWMGRLQQRLPDAQAVLGWSAEDRDAARTALEPAAKLYEALKTT